MAGRIRPKNSWHRDTVNKVEKLLQFFQAFTGGGKNCLPKLKFASIISGELNGGAT